jgi:hypothetical protein
MPSNGSADHNTRKGYGPPKISLFYGDERMIIKCYFLMHRRRRSILIVERKPDLEENLKFWGLVGYA